jgi:uncharacterized protein YwqG
MNWFKQLFQKVTVTGESKPAGKPAEPVVEQATVEQVSARFGHLAQPAVHLRGGRPGFCKLGGLPTLPSGAEWPQWKGKPQAFLAQIDLAEVHAALSSFLPPTGFLFFFYDQEQSVWGFDPKDRGGWQVLFSDAARESLHERPAPAGLAEEYIYQAKRVTPFAIDLLPDSQRLPPTDFAWKRDGDAYTKLREAAFDGETRHQMLGFPSPVQGDEMELECQLASNGIYVGGPEGYKDPRRAQLEPGAAEWKLLLQLDTDDDTGWMWGDVGTIYYWVRESDARRGDFSQVWLSYQCC